MRELSRQDLMDILCGATILGAGGGGDIQEGIDLIDHAIACDKSFKLASIDEVPDDAIICTPYFLGAISELPPEEEALYTGLPQSDEHPMLKAYDAFQTYLGQDFYGTTPCEMGGSNTAVAFFAAAMRGHVVVDGDPAGRAVPEITHSTYYLAGLPASPIFAANEFGETFVFENVKDDKRAETLVRNLSTVSRHNVSAIDHALPMKLLKNVLIPNTLSQAMELGRAWREAHATGQNPADIIAQVGGGVFAFQGNVTQAFYETQAGFTIGSVEINGTETYLGQNMRVSVKNENMACWIDGNVVATIPDLICIFDQDTGAHISNPDVKLGQRVVVIFLPSPDAFRTEFGLDIFGPRYAGIDQPYRPIKKCG